MPLELVIGPANSAKAGAVFGALEAAAARGPALLVVPTAGDARHYLRELVGRGVTVGAQVVTFAGLAREIAAATGLSPAVLSPLQRERVLARAVERARASGRLQLLARSAEGAGFVRGAGALVAELERSLVPPGRFAQALRTWAAAAPGRARLADELAALPSLYAAELDRLRLPDADLLMWRGLDALRARPAAWGARPVFVYGFDDLHRLERDAVETLARVVGALVTVSLTYETGHPALAARAEAVEELRPLADRVTELPAADEHYAPAARPALHALERGLFAPAGGDGDGGRPRPDPGEAVTLLEAGGERAEAELIAATAAGLIAGGIPAEEIAVVLRSPADAAPLMERAFAAVGLPLACERTVPLAHAPLGAALVALARCAAAPPGGPRRARAADLLPYLRAPGVLADPRTADRLELAIARGEVEDLPGAGRVLGADGRALLDAVRELRDADDPLAALAARARRLLAAPREGAAPVFTGPDLLDAGAVRAVLTGAAELAAIGERPGADELPAVLAALRVECGRPAGEGAVLLASPLAIRARRFRAVIIGSLQEGTFPAPAPVDPFLPDELRHELALTAGLRLRRAGDPLAAERYLFYSCLARATERIVLAYRSSDEDGSLALPSPFIADVAAALADGPTGLRARRRRRLLADVVWPAEEAPTARERLRAQAAAGPAGGAVAGAEVVGAEVAGSAVAGAEVVGERRLGPAALAVARHAEVLSPGALERYAECPMRWLVEGELRPTRFEPEPYPLARGSHMHTVLEQTLRRLGAAVGPATLARAEELLAEVIAELPVPEAYGRSPAVRAGVLRAVESDLRRYLRAEAAGGNRWPASELEVAFGFEPGEAEGPSLPPLVLGEGADAVRLRGVIDRIDVEPGGRRAVVRDYKSGANKPGYAGARWLEDRALQVALYMLVVRDLMGLEPVAGVYQPLTGGDLRARGIRASTAPAVGAPVDRDEREPAEIDALLDDVAEVTVELAARLRAGELRATPDTCSRFGCAFPGICRSAG